MPAVGLEPTRGYPQQILSLHRLPFRHAGEHKTYISIDDSLLQEKYNIIIVKFVIMDYNYVYSIIRGIFIMKKIAILVDGWKKYVNYAWVKGCQNYIGEHNLDVNLYIFHSFGNYSKGEKFNRGEYNIYNLPNLDEFDGIIMELTNVSSKEIKEKIIKKVQQSNTPAVAMVEHIPGLYYVGIDNYLAMERLVEHLVTVHNAKTLCYIGGPVASDENCIRFQAYKDVLERHKIPLDEKLVYHCSYDISTGEDGFKYFEGKGIIPDAFVCANDNIAVGVCHQADKMGYTVPDDFMVTGFDNFDKAAYFSPRITTAGFTRDSIAYQAMHAIHHIWKGEHIKKSAHYADVEWEFQESCGCKAVNPRSRGEFVVDRIFKEEFENKLQNELLELKRDLVEANSFQELADCVEKKFSFFGCSSIYIMLNSDIIEGEDFSKINSSTTAFIQDGYPEELDVIVACDEDGNMNHCTLLRDELFPGEDHEEGKNMFLFVPLHFRDQEVGYMTLKNCHFLMDTQQIFEIVSVFQEALEHLYQRIVLKRMNEELEKLYIMDSLTGLYNRMAYSHLAEPLFDRCRKEHRKLAVLFCDVDRLKYINDNFGHDSGNVAIKNLALALSHCITEDSVAIRYGGDEFLVLIPDVDEKQVEEILNNVNAMIERTTEALGAGFSVSVSIGYTVVCDYEKAFNDYINIADEHMYENKEKRKTYLE